MSTPEDMVRAGIERAAHDHPGKDAAVAAAIFALRAPDNRHMPIDMAVGHAVGAAIDALAKTERPQSRLRRPPVRLNSGPPNEPRPAIDVRRDRDRLMLCLTGRSEFINAADAEALAIRLLDWVDVLRFDEMFGVADRQASG